MLASRIEAENQTETETGMNPSDWLLGSCHDRRKRGSQLEVAQPKVRVVEVESGLRIW